MKKLYFLLLFVPAIANGINYVSQANGNWGTITTWNPNGIPGAGDNVTINNSVTASDPYDRCLNLTINSGGVLTVNSGTVLDIFNLTTNNAGGTLTGAGNIFFGGPANGTFLTGGGNFNGETGNWFFAGSSNPGIQTETIDATVSITKNGGNIYIYTGYVNNSIRIMNFGKILMLTGAVSNNGSKPDAWYQEANSQFETFNHFLVNSYDTLDASGTNNIVTYAGLNSFAIKNPVGGVYYNIHFNNGTKSLPANIIVKGLFQIDAPDAAVNFAGFNVTVGGNWINNSIAKLTNLTGTVTFNGAALQTLGGTHNTRFANVTISGTGGVNLATGSGFTGVLTLNNSGSLSSSAGISDTLVSNSGSTARVANITGSGTITANFVVQRYDGRNVAQYQILSSPVQATSLGDWNISNRNPPFYMSGVGGPDGNAQNYVSVYIFNEPNDSYDAITLYSIPGVNYPLHQGQGIYLWMGNNLVSMSPFSYITHGVPSVGTISRNVTNTPAKGAGFNIIGNPFPSPISWSSFLASNASLQNTYYIFEQDGSWHTFGAGSIIPMEQGFGIISSSTVNLSFQESHKSNVDGALLRANGDPSKEDNSTTFTLSDDVNSFSCPAIISFGSNYVPEYNSTEDAIFIKSFIHEVPKLYTVSQDNKNLALNRLSDASNEVDVPLTAVGNVVGNYTLSSQNISNLSTYNCVCLIDKNTGTVLNNFEDNPSYTFNVSLPGQEKDFILRFTKLTAGQSCNSIASALTINKAPEDIQIYSSTAGATVRFQLTQPEDVVISAYTAMGQKVIDDIHTNAYNNQLNIALPSSVEIYTVRIETPNGVILKKLYR